MASRLCKQVDRLPLIQVPHGWGQGLRVGPLSSSVLVFWGLISHGPQSGGDGGRGHSLGGLFCIFDSAGCPFLK